MKYRDLRAKFLDVANKAEKCADSAAASARRKTQQLKGLTRSEATRIALDDVGGT